MSREIISSKRVSKRCEECNKEMKEQIIETKLSNGFVVRERIYSCLCGFTEFIEVMR